MGAVQPPSNLFKNSRSIVVQISVSSWFSSAQIARVSSSSSKAVIIMAPCAGAGIIQSKLIASSGLIPILPIPAAAKIAPFQSSLSSNFCKREFTLPRNPTIVCEGNRFNHCARRRKLPVAIMASLEPKNSSLFL